VYKNPSHWKNFPVKGVDSMSSIINKSQLEIYIAQGEAMKKLLISTNRHGKHDQKIKKLGDKIARAKRALAKIN